MYNIAISGRICVGKSTVANILRDHYGYNVVTLAQPIYTAAAISRRYIAEDTLFPYHLAEFVETLIEGPVGEVVHEWVKLMAKHTDLLLSGKKPRAFLQDWGMMIREYDEEAFIRAAIENADGLSVNDDCRMWNELWAFQEAGWKTVRIALPEEVRMARVAEQYPEQLGMLGHRTETELDGFQEWSYVLDGGCPKEDLLGRVGEMLLSFG